MNGKEINQIFEQFSRKRALVIGDAMVDTYLWGNIERISPEAPVPVVSVTNRESRLGGSANVALNLQALGARPVLFSVVGNDNKGSEFRAMLKKNNLSDRHIFTDTDRVTTVKNRIIGKGQHIARVDEETTGYITPELENSLFSGIKQEIEENKVDVIIFVDYDKGVITPSLFRKVNELAKQHEIPVAVDPKKRNFSHYKDVGLFKPNFREFADGAGLSLKKGDMKTLVSSAHKIKEKQNIGLIFITLSELGVFISNGTEKEYFPAVIRYIADVSGAGDTVISVASLAMAAGISPKKMALMSNIAGGLVCEKPGVIPVDKNQLIEVMKSQNF